jgi:hypothetical protein
MKDNLAALLAGEDDVEVSIAKGSSSAASPQCTASEASSGSLGEGAPVIELYTTMLGFLEEGRNQLFLDQDRENWTDGRVGGKPVRRIVLSLLA